MLRVRMPGKNAPPAALPTLPILVWEAGELYAFSSVHAAEHAMEPADVRKGAYRAFDAAGRALGVRVEEHRGKIFGVVPARSEGVVLSLAEQEPAHEAELSALLWAFAVRANAAPAPGPKGQVAHEDLVRAAVRASRAVRASAAPSLTVLISLAGSALLLPVLKAAVDGRVGPAMPLGLAVATALAILWARSFHLEVHADSLVWRTWTGTRSVAMPDIEDAVVDYRFDALAPPLRLSIRVRGQRPLAINLKILPAPAVAELLAALRAHGKLREDLGLDEG